MHPCVHASSGDPRSGWVIDKSGSSLVARPARVMPEVAESDELVEASIVGEAISSQRPRISRWTAPETTDSDDMGRPDVQGIR